MLTIPSVPTRYQYQHSITLVLLCTLLLHNCQSQLNALKEETPSKEPPESGLHEPATSSALTTLPAPLPPASQPPRPPASFRIIPITPQNRKTLATATSSRPLSPTAASAAQPTASAHATGATQKVKEPKHIFSNVFTASSGEYVSFQEENGQWQAIVQSAPDAYTPQRTMPVVSSESIGPFLSWMQRQGTWTSKARIHLLNTAQPPYSPCVYLGKTGLLGGMFGAAGIEEQIPAMAFGKEQWHAYFGVDVGKEPALPSNIETILDKECPFNLEGEETNRRVGDNHLLVLMPSTVNGAPFTLNRLGELIKSKFLDNKEGYCYYSSYARDAVGTKMLSHAPYWILITRDILAGSRSKSYSKQKEMVAPYASQGYRLPHALEAATAILTHYVRSGERERLFSDDPCTYMRCLDMFNNKYPFVVGGFSSGGLNVYYDHCDGSSFSGVSFCRKFLGKTGLLGGMFGAAGIEEQIPAMAFGKEQWHAYFGVDVGKEPALPSNIETILDKECPFNLEGEETNRRVGDNHLLVLMPSTVNGAPFTLNRLGELIKSKFLDNKEGYCYYSSYARDAVGTKMLSHAPYWILITRDILAGSRSKSYSKQKEMVAPYASQGYRLPHALEAATAILTHYVRSGERERLFSDDPLTYTRCLDVIQHGDPFVVGGFSSDGLGVLFSLCDRSCSGTSCCRKL